MDKLQQRFLIAGLAAVLLGASDPPGKRFYPDDPLWKMPPPVAVNNPPRRKLNYLYDFVISSVATPGEKQQPGALIPASDVNTLGEVPDGLWYTNRHYWHPMSLDDLRRGSARDNQPVLPFRVTGAKTEGITPGFQMRDARGRLFFCKPDPGSNPDMATAADVVGSKFFYAFGYETPENYISYFTPNDITIDPEAKVSPPGGKQRKLERRDLDRVLTVMPRDSDGRYRIIASLALPGKGVGPFRWVGVREDDPNDLYLHEHRRSLRGLYVFCAWLNHTDIKSDNTYDSVVDWNGVPVIRHFLIDFGSSLGSDSDEPKNARFGHEYMIEKDKKVLVKMLGLGLYSPDWERANYPHIRSVGRFEAKTFHPDSWTSNFPVSAFLNRLPDDEFWAAKQVMAFTPTEIRAMVETGQYSDRRAVDYITNTLLERREKIGRVFFGKVLPLDRFQVRGGELVFEDLAVKYGLESKRDYEIQWSRFDNATRQRTTISSATGPRVPGEGEFTVAEIRSKQNSEKTVSVYLRGSEVVGVDRKW